MPQWAADLLAEIRGFEPADERERAHQISILALLQTPNFFSRDQFDPGHLTASAFIVDLATARLLLHHHRSLDRWLQMGGHLDPGEPPRDAALREASEESGLSDLTFLSERIIDLDVHEIPAHRSEPAHRHFDLRYGLTTRRAADTSRHDQESLALAWFPFDQAIRRMNEPCSTRAIRKIRHIVAAP
jgi:8-oxo-dGTP pyrophosphatase MutT (NUDIX family)